MGGGQPTSTTTTSNSASVYDLPNTASYAENNWIGPSTASSMYSERAWTTENPSLNLQNLAWLGADGQVHTVKQPENGPRLRGASQKSMLGSVKPGLQNLPYLVQDG